MTFHGGRRHTKRPHAPAATSVGYKHRIMNDTRKAFDTSQRGVLLDMLVHKHKHWAHGVVVSHPLRMRKALGSDPNVSVFATSKKLARVAELVINMTRRRGVS